MESRDLISADPPRRILIDSSIQSPEASRIIRYEDHDFFKLLRTPEEPNLELVTELPTYDFEESPVADESIIKSGSLSVAYDYDEELLEDSVKKADPEMEISPSELKVAGVQGSFNAHSEKGLFITESDYLLSNRRALERSLGPGRDERHLNIITPTEAIEILGLYLRYRDDYSYIPKSDRITRFGRDTTAWYWNLFDVLIDNYLGEPPGLSSFRSRFINLFLGLDEMGYWYYKGVDNITSMYMTYHLDHCIALITGIFDSLAIHTQAKYEISEHKGRELRPNEISLQLGQEFLKEIRRENEELANLIHQYHEFIGLMYVIRPIVIHREGLLNRGAAFHAPWWDSHMIDIGKIDDDDMDDFYKYHDGLDDNLKEFDPISEWGIYVDPEVSREEVHTFENYLEPYQFLKKSVRELVDFSVTYFEILGYTHKWEDKVEADPELENFKGSILCYLI